MYVHMPALHVCVKTCVFNSNKRDVLRTSWAVSHGLVVPAELITVSLVMELLRFGFVCVVGS